MISIFPLNSIYDLISNDALFFILLRSSSLGLYFSHKIRTFLVFVRVQLLKPTGNFRTNCPLTISCYVPALFRPTHPP